METTPNSVWTFLSHVEFPAEMAPFLVAGEVPVASFKTVRDTATFTNRRLIVRDAQGLRGKKIETVSIPYSSISMWSTENAGTLDFNAEIQLWTRAGCHEDQRGPRHRRGRPGPAHRPLRPRLSTRGPSTSAGGRNHCRGAYHGA